MDIDFPGYTDPSRFLIADIAGTLPLQPEHQFTFEPISGSGQTQLVLPQADGLWRMDWQLFGGEDITDALDPEHIQKRVQAIIGTEVPFEIRWKSCYNFEQRIMETFRHGQVFFVGDAAHAVGPFGARGMNSGIHDAENLAWKLAAVVNNQENPSILDTYDIERRSAQIIHQRISEETIRFLSPRTTEELRNRNELLAGSVTAPELRKQVQCGRMYSPPPYTHSPLNMGNHPLVGTRIPDFKISDDPPVYIRTLIGHSDLILHISDQAEMRLETGGEMPILHVSSEASPTSLREACGQYLTIRPDSHVKAVSNDLTDTNS